MGYPIITLGLEERSLTNLVTRVEESILRTLAEFAIGGRREPTERGVWVGERKIASIGMAVRRWTTLHGMALNVDPDLRYFTYINPCGHPHLAMTSMALELGHAVDTSVVAAVFARHFATAFGRHAAATVQEHHGW